MKLFSLFVDIEVPLRKLRRGMNNAQRVVSTGASKMSQSLKRASGAANGLNGALGSILAPVAIVAAIDGIVSGLLDAKDRADEFDRAMNEAVNNAAQNFAVLSGRINETQAALLESNKAQQDIAQATIDQVNSMRLVATAFDQISALTLGTATAQERVNQALETQNRLARISTAELKERRRQAKQAAAEAEAEAEAEKRRIAEKLAAEQAAEAERTRIREEGIAKRKAAEDKARRERQAADTAAARVAFAQREESLKNQARLLAQQFEEVFRDTTAVSIDVLNAQLTAQLERVANTGRNLG